MKSYDLVIKNGTIVTATDMYQADLAVKDGRIAAIEQNLDPAEAGPVYAAHRKLARP